MKHLPLAIVLIIAVLCMPLMAAEDTKLSTYTYNLQKGWNLIGIVLEPTDESEQELLAHKLYDYNGEKNVKSYQQSTEVTAGKSYWIYSAADESLVIKGTRIDSPTDEPAPQEGSYAFVIGSYDERAAGDEVTVTAPEKEGYTFAGWTVDGASVPDTTQGTITFTMPANKVTVATNYDINSYTLTVDGVSEQVTYGAEVSKTAATKEGYVFAGWTVEGVTLEDASAATISFPMPSNNVVLTTNYEGIYMIVNLTDGSYSYTGTAPNLSDNTCRTTELWLRRIPAGTFTMGSPTDEVGRVPKDAKETQHEVTLTEDFYIGIFEMTQKQCSLIDSSISFSEGEDCLPNTSVGYGRIRGTGTASGAGWPAYGHVVDEGSLMAKLREQTGLLFDLPTEAQWEYACRAGTTTALNTGKNLTSADQDEAMAEAGRYCYNTSDGVGGYNGKTKVGSYLPNTLGLYDMHGNVWEQCLDWYQSDLGSDAVTDPSGPSAGTVRLLRGGAYGSFGAGSCRSANRDYGDCGCIDRGFRVVMLPNVTP